MESLGSSQIFLPVLFFSTQVFLILSCFSFSLLFAREYTQTPVYVSMCSSSIHLVWNPGIVLHVPHSVTESYGVACNLHVECILLHLHWRGRGGTNATVMSHLPGFLASPVPSLFPKELLIWLFNSPTKKAPIKIRKTKKYTLVTLPYNNLHDVDIAGVHFSGKAKAIP